MYRRALIALLSLTTCAKPTAADRTLEVASAARKALDTQQKEVETLKAEVLRLSAENARLQETEEGLWARTVSADADDDFETARVLYGEFEARFPTSHLTPAVADALSKLNDRHCSALIAAMESDLEATEQSVVAALNETALEDGTLKRACTSTVRLARIRSVRVAAAEALAKWPSAMSIAEFTARHIELRGKRALLRGSLTVNTYYGLGYANRERLRSFRIDDQKDFAHVYCERGPRCDALLSKALKDQVVVGDWVVENSARYFDAVGSGMGLLVLGGQP